MCTSARQFFFSVTTSATKKTVVGVVVVGIGMPNRKERQDVRMPPRSETFEQSKSRVRIGRACDRCKIKKSKVG